MTSIILAAGMGRRLSLGRPKCLIDIAGRTILDRQLAALRSVGVDRFVLVVGYQQELVRQQVEGQPGSFEFIINERYAETNTIYSLYLAREHFGGGFFYCNGDVVFDGRLTQRLLPANDASVMAVQPGRCGQEEVKVIVHDGCITRIGKALDPAESLGEFVGVARFGTSIIPPFREALSRCVEAEGIVGEHFERAVDRLCAAGHRITPVDIGDLPCSEIDFADDLQLARNEIAPRLAD